MPLCRAVHGRVHRFEVGLTPFCPGAHPDADEHRTGPGTVARPPALLVSGQPGLDRWRKAIHGHRHESPIWRDHATGSSPAPYARGVAGGTAGGPPPPCPPPLAGGGAAGGPPPPPH